MRMVDTLKLGVGIFASLGFAMVDTIYIPFVGDLLSVIAVFVVVAIVGFCRGYQSVWLFVLTALASIPINIRYVKFWMPLGLLDPGIPVVGPIINGIEMYLLFLAVEELIISYIGRLIWRKQNDITKRYWEE